jgi:hypothetical protein
MLNAVRRAMDTVSVLAGAVYVNWARSRVGPAPLIASLRARGRRRIARTPSERARLRRLIGAVDRRFPSGPNCYRRVLTEVLLDAGAAHEAVHLGLSASGLPGSGHVWLHSDPPSPTETYEAELVT